MLSFGHLNVVDEGMSSCGYLPWISYVVSNYLVALQEKNMVTNLSQDDFESKVLKADNPVVVELWGLRCGFCEKLDPIFKEVGEKASEDAYFYQLLVNDNIELARKLKVMGVPMILFFNHGVLVGKMKGLQSGVKITKQLDKIKDFTPDEAQKNEYKPFLKRLFKGK